MQALEQDYIDQLEAIAASIQESEALVQYLETEDEADYKGLQESYEHIIGELHEEVARQHPLQLITFEKILLDPAFEGLFLPRALCYSVLRGEVSPIDWKYTRPQDHFKEILMNIIESPNFEWLKKRIGQTIQTGFMLSSDIWITNLIAAITNKRIRYYLQSMKVDKFRYETERAAAFHRYKRQFNNDVYFSCEFPETSNEMKASFPFIRTFLHERLKRDLDNTSIISEMRSFVENPDLQGTEEHVEGLLLYANFFNLDEEHTVALTNTFNEVRIKHSNFVEMYLAKMLETLREDLDVTPECDIRVSTILDKSVKDDLTAYYILLDQVHKKGYESEESIEAIRLFHNRYEGLSNINQCVRQIVHNYIRRFMASLKVRDYRDYFSRNRTFNEYMRVFANQQFNQGLEDMVMGYVNESLKQYTDKRGTDYQSIKKFVTSHFVDMGFMKEKEIVDMFKTRRKRTKKE